jgi:hypothetical protein
MKVPTMRRTERLYSARAMDWAQALTKGRELTPFVYKGQIRLLPTMGGLGATSELLPSLFRCMVQNQDSQDAQTARSNGEKPGE